MDSSPRLYSRSRSVVNLLARVFSSYRTVLRQLYAELYILLLCLVLPAPGLRVLAGFSSWNSSPSTTFLRSVRSIHFYLFGQCHIYFLYLSYPETVLVHPRLCNISKSGALADHSTPAVTGTFQVRPFLSSELLSPSIAVSLAIHQPHNPYKQGQHLPLHQW